MRTQIIEKIIEIQDTKHLFLALTKAISERIVSINKTYYIIKDFMKRIELKHTNYYQISHNMMKSQKNQFSEIKYNFNRITILLQFFYEGQFELLLMNCNFQVEGYEIDYENILGKGEYGIVLECKSLNYQEMNEQLCIKVIEVSDQVSALREASILNCLSEKAIFNINVVKVKKVVYYQKKRMMGVVMEKCQSNLQQELEKKKKFTNIEVRDFLRQIIQGYDTLHKNRIIHRDIKPENILINYVNNSPIYKLADFGVGKIYEENDCHMTKAKGTPAYAPPEINVLIQQKFGNIDEDLESDSATCWKDQSPVDVYSIGIILYQLLYGKLPFATNCEDIKLFFQKLKNNEFKLPCENTDQELVKVIQEMIVYMPSKRISFQLLKQRFVNNSQFIASFHQKRNSLCDAITQSTDQQSDWQKQFTNQTKNFSKQFKKQNSFAFSQIQQNQTNQNNQLNSPKLCSPNYNQFTNQFQLNSPKDSKPFFEQTIILQNYEKQMLQELKENLQFLYQSSICLNEWALKELQICIQNLNSTDFKRFQISIQLNNLKSAFAYDPTKNYTNNYIRFLFLFAYFAYGKQFNESIINLSAEEQKRYLDNWKQLILMSQ